MAINFNAILDKKAEEIERRKKVPESSAYLGNIIKTSLGESNQKKTPFLAVSMVILDGGQDVSQEALAEVGGTVVGLKITEKFYLTEDALGRLLDFAEKHVGLEISGRSLREIVEALPNNQVGFGVKHSPTQDGLETRDEVARTFNWGKFIEGQTMQAA